MEFIGRGGFEVRHINVEMHFTIVFHPNHSIRETRIVFLHNHIILSLFSMIWHIVFRATDGKHPCAQHAYK